MGIQPAIRYASGNTILKIVQAVNFVGSKVRLNNAHVKGLKKILLVKKILHVSENQQTRIPWYQLLWFVPCSIGTCQLIHQGTFVLNYIQLTIMNTKFQDFILSFKNVVSLVRRYVLLQRSRKVCFLVVKFSVVY